MERIHYNFRSSFSNLRKACFPKLKHLEPFQRLEIFRGKEMQQLYCLGIYCSFDSHLYHLYHPCNKYLMSIWKIMKAVPSKCWKVTKLPSYLVPLDHMTCIIDLAPNTLFFLLGFNSFGIYFWLYICTV